MPPCSSHIGNALKLTCKEATKGIPIACMSNIVVCLIDFLLLVADIIVIVLFAGHLTH